MVCLQLEGASSPLALPSLHCDERYASLVLCGGRRFLFTRLETGDDQWTSLARVSPPPNLNASSQPSGAVRLRHHHPDHHTLPHSLAYSSFPSPSASLTFSPPVTTLPSTFRLSHNAAFTCLHDSTLLAYGGQAFFNSKTERGILRFTASAHEWPLRWLPPSLAISGDPSLSGCVEERPLPPLWPTSPRPPDGFTCEFDGKLSVLQHGWCSPMFSTPILCLPCPPTLPSLTHHSSTPPNSICTPCPHLPSRPFPTLPRPSPPLTSPLTAPPFQLLSSFLPSSLLRPSPYRSSSLPLFSPPPLETHLCRGAQEAGCCSSRALICTGSQG